jgi:4-hydroxybutyryl-CoA dehydratase/vinylacetyl-CoA-Delta-isomerase
MMMYVQDIAGGAIVTAPMPGDLDNAETRGYVDKYMRTRSQVAGEYRTRLFHAARDLTVSAGAGHWQVVALMGGGGLYAQKLVATVHYDMERAKRLALRLASLEEPTQES